MPDDLLVGFEFFTDGNTPAIVSDNARRVATQHLENEIAYNNAISHLDNAIQAVGAAARRNDLRDDPDWQDNVPPDLTGVDDFLL